MVCGPYAHSVDTWSKSEVQEEAVDQHCYSPIWFYTYVPNHRAPGVADSVLVSQVSSQTQESQRETHKGNFAGPSLPAHTVGCILNWRPILHVLSALFPNVVIKGEWEIKPYISFTVLHHFWCLSKDTSVKCFPQVFKDDPRKSHFRSQTWV